MAKASRKPRGTTAIPTTKAATATPGAAPLARSVGLTGAESARRSGAPKSRSVRDQRWAQLLVSRKAVLVDEVLNVEKHPNGYDIDHVRIRVDVIVSDRQGGPDVFRDVAGARLVQSCHPESG